MPVRRRQPDSEPGSVASHYWGDTPLQPSYKIVSGHPLGRSYAREIAEQHGISY